MGRLPAGPRTIARRMRPQALNSIEFSYAGTQTMREPRNCHSSVDDRRTCAGFGSFLHTNIAVTGGDTTDCPGTRWGSSTSSERKQSLKGRLHPVGRATRPTGPLTTTGSSVTRDADFTGRVQPTVDVSLLGRTPTETSPIHPASLFHRDRMPRRSLRPGCRPGPEHRSPTSHLLRDQRAAQYQ